MICLVVFSNKACVHNLRIADKEKIFFVNQKYKLIVYMSRSKIFIPILRKCLKCCSEKRTETKRNTPIQRPIINAKLRS